ncbi:hypothetical protein Poli38472_000920 [Pythium oligandrum]|uniref:Glycosyl transferase family 1 domain-containing protein n=1 Tax=Pythium oligandrum TaxID=41045 RepID=A0A8K1CE29_PYTOL|nr:hypothetical protein Poli38472_000920 [Pythium oligandrum]|eukprot:TMW60878.1 hypothetical protein Poli38472_000920 [Pythium oligandrum]
MMRWTMTTTLAVLLGALRAVYALGKGAAVSQPPAVLWYAPFLSGGGYCSEAHSYVAAMESAIHDMQLAAEKEATEEKVDKTDGYGHFASSSSTDGDENEQEYKKLRPFSLYVTQHGDSYNAVFIRDLPNETRELLQEHWIEERDFHWRLQHQQVALAICHSEPGAWHPARYKTSDCPPPQALYKVGRTMFETDRVPSGWPDRMNAMDEIWVPTKFQEKVFVDGGVRPESVQVVPEAVDIHFFDPAKVEAPYDLAAAITERTVTQDTTVFLSVFKWEERKAWRVLLKAYFQAFKQDDDVVLAILTNAYHVASESAKDFRDIMDEFAQAEVGKSLQDLPYVHVLPPHLPQEQLPALYKSASAFVLPSRGEGWGRPHVEAMAMELPIISTFWSGTTEYMTEENSYPLRIDGLIEIQEGAFRGHKWADPSVEHLIELLQRVKTHPEEARAKGKQARRDMVTKYSPEVIGKVLLGHIERILAVVAKREKLAAAEQDDGTPEHEEL